MDVKDLRLGNLIYNDVLNHTERINTIYDTGVINFSLDKTYSGIPLTEEWLLKFGYSVERITDYNYFRFPDHPILNGTLCDFGMNFMNIEIPCKYVHQFQNLYAALTGKELTI